MKRATDIEIAKYIDCTSLALYQERNNVLALLNNEAVEIDLDSDDVATQFLGEEKKGGDKFLEFGCGNGRWMKYFAKYFGLAEGCDISEICLEATNNNLRKAMIDYRLWKVNYLSIADIPNNEYDFIYSITVFQHMPIYTMRRRYLEQLYDKLKVGGRIAIQFGCGDVHFSKPESGLVSQYYEDCVETRWTNSKHDVQIANVDNVIQDFEEIGFKNVHYLSDKTSEEDKKNSWMYHDEWLIMKGTK